MKKKLAPILLGLGLVSLAACSNDGEENTDSASTEEGDVEFGSVLATSDAGDVTADDVLNQIGTNQVANQTFQLVLDKVLTDKYSEELNMDELNEQIDAEIEQYGGEENFAMMLQQSQPGMTVDTYKQQRVSNALNDLYFADYFEITDEEAFDSVRKSSHILVSFAEEGEEGEEDAEDAEGEEDEAAMTKEEAKTKADDLKKQLDDGADFGELASENSDDTGSAQQNGELGYVSKGQMVEEFETALFELEPGEISEPVESQFGYHIILNEDVSLEDTPKEELDTIKTQLVNQKIQEDPSQALQGYRDLLEEYNVSFENEEIQSYIEETFLNADEALENAQQEDAAAEEESEGAPTEENAEEESENEESADTEEDSE
ncbi:peptidylprolyl isomerase [Jeotgalicoccus halotolerans]|uniref:peptidylprolyl isomerase n=1 Tax=Jeotgalicoccus halotolerans TaxID=157227 RepID=A0A3E0AZY3_9STAP|nr:peptidylprolyl isomerase [Jeotgalicoccus halotolerans]REG25245.1 foldase protein PrsA [Jeotgalicoccus halotolerans]